MPSNTHVPRQLHGYSLQFTECLSVLLDADVGTSVSVEILDDVALHSEGGKVHLTQTKAGLGANPIADGSVELWKTIRNWIDQINSKEIDPIKTTFTLYVGASQKGKLCSLMSDALTAGQVADVVAKVKARFVTPRTKKLRRELGTQIREQLEVVLNPGNEKQFATIILNFAYRHGSGSSYADLHMKFARMAIQDSLVGFVMERMAGWVKLRLDCAIESGNPPIISVTGFRDELTSFHVKLINHPFLDWFTNGNPTEEMAEHSSRTYYRQLVLIDAEQTELMEAVGNYLAASANAVRYQQAGLINETSLREYSDELQALWTNLRKKLELQGTTKGDVHFGKSLLIDCYLQKTKLQGSEVPTTFMCGSFHSLADDLEVGWHPKFRDLLGGGDGSV